MRRTRKQLPDWQRRARLTVLFFWVLLLVSVAMHAQTTDQGVTGIDKATDIVKKYFERGILLLYGLGAFLGLYGAVKVYSKWSSGDQETQRYAAAWFGGCIFLVLVVTVLKSFFGL